MCAAALVALLIALLVALLVEFLLALLVAPGRRGYRCAILSGAREAYLAPSACSACSDYLEEQALQQGCQHLSKVLNIAVRPLELCNLCI